MRSLAVIDRAKGGGWGSTLVKGLIIEAQRRGVVTLFALTRAVSFFQRAGFHISDRQRFPEKVWRDCVNCPLIDRCDETAVVLHLTVPLTHSYRPPTAGYQPTTVGLPTLAPAQPITHRPQGERIIMTKPAVNKVCLLYTSRCV